MCEWIHQTRVQSCVYCESVPLIKQLIEKLQFMNSTEYMNRNKLYLNMERKKHNIKAPLCRIFPCFIFSHPSIHNLNKFNRKLSKCMLFYLPSYIDVHTYNLYIFLNNMPINASNKLFSTCNPEYKYLLFWREIEGKKHIYYAYQLSTYLKYWVTHKVMFLWK